MDEQLTNDTLSAIAVMTAVVTEPDEANRLAAEIVNEWGNEHPDGANRVVFGFVQLSMMLLTQLHLRTGEPFEAPLQVAAGVINSWDDD
jgi:hypothetical protein